MDALLELAQAVVAMFNASVGVSSVGQTFFDTIMAPLLWLLGL